MNKTRWIMLVAVVAVIGLLGGLAGGKLDSILETEKGTEGIKKQEGSILEAYDFGIVFLDGSTAFPDAHGVAVFEAKRTESILKVRLEGVPELANTTLNVFIELAAADGAVETEVQVGVLSVDSKGRGKYEIKAPAGSGLLPVVDDGSEIRFKQTGVSGNKLVASGTF
ncbi:MAG: hypothetical protein HYX84_02855 [Chloroflexi bacterium]|nr:hypothetical protein [Chloroflexota bacterium]